MTESKRTLNYQIIIKDVEGETLYQNSIPHIPEKFHNHHIALDGTDYIIKGQRVEICSKTNVMALKLVVKKTEPIKRLKSSENPMLRGVKESNRMSKNETIQRLRQMSRKED